MKQILQKSFALKAFMLIATLIMGVSGAWAEKTAGFTITSAPQASVKSGTFTGTQNETWNWVVNTSSSDYSSSLNSGFWQIGKNGGPAESAIFSTSGISGTISKIAVTCSSYGNKATVSATVGGAAFGTQEQATPKWNTTGDVVFEGSASGDIVVTMTNANDGRAMYIKSITVTYDDGTVDLREDVTLSFPEDSYEATLGETFTAPTLTVDPSAAATEVVYSSSNTKAATVAEDGTITLVGAGSTTITASISNNTTYKDASASYLLTVTKVMTIEDGVFDFESKFSDYGSGVETTTENIYIEEDRTWTAGNVTLVTSGKYRWWDNDGTLRFYNGETSSMTISVPDGYVITGINITGGQAFTANVGEYASGTWTGTAQSVKLSSSSTSSVNVKTVTVTYEEGEAVEVPVPTFNPEAGEVAAGTTVEIICPAEADGVEYSFDQTNWDEYEDPIEITEATTIYARAYDTDGNYSEVVSATYTIQEAAGGIVFDLTVSHDNLSNISESGVVVDFEKANAGNAPVFNANASETRLYAKGTLTVSCETKRITKIVYTYKVNKNSSGNAPTIVGVTGSTSDGTWDEETTTWTGADNAVTMTLGGTAGNFGFSKIVVYLEEGATKVTPTVAIGATELEVNGTTEITTDGPALTIESDDPDVVSVSGNTLTAESAGSAVITVTWPETDEFFGGTKTFNITVVDPNTPGSTIDNPLTVAQVLALFDDNNVPTSEVYVSGIISRIKSLNVPTYNRAQYYISDDGSTENEFYVYNGFFLDGANFTSNDQIQPGDQVIVLGTLTSYNGTDEFAANNKIVYFNRPVAAVEKPEFSIEAGTYNGSQTVEITCPTDGATIYYTIDGSEPTAESTEYTGSITISETTTLKAIAIKGEDQSAITEATYTIKTVEDGVFDFTSKFTDYGSGVEPISSSSEYIYEEKTWTAVNVTLVSSGKYRWWENGGELRFYRTDNDENATSPSAMTISVPNGKVITQIVVTGGTSFTADCGTYEAGTWTGSSQTVVLTLEGTEAQKVETVTVTYENTSSTLKGDVNDDGSVTLADVSALLDIVLGRVTPENNPNNYIFDAAYVNNDEDITIADVTALINIILGR